MSTIQVLDKEFTPSIPASDILEKVKTVAKQINADYEGEAPLFLVVLNGAFVFAADLLREICLPAEVSFVKLASYEGYIFFKTSGFGKSAHSTKRTVA